MKKVNKGAIIEAIQMVEEAQGLVDEAVKGTIHEGHYRAYGRYGFDQLLENGNPYDSGLMGLLNDEDEEEEE